MEDADKQVFKLKFWKLTIILNIIIIFVALAIGLYFKAPQPYGPAIAGALILADIPLIWYFRKDYYRTKAWLDVHATPREKKEDHA
jgi:membrane protein YdbS with pleckstrin-like domain